ncbi:MAG: SDR family oxidoreductase [Gammaproteobacteria bacterium]
MDLGLRGRIALVAGGSRGCGRGISEVLAEEGARVVLTGRNRDAVEAAERAIRERGGAVAGVVADMTTEAGVATIVASARSAFGDPDILVVNSPGPMIDAETGARRGFEACADQDYLDVFNSHVISAVRLTRALLPAMKARRWGRILNIGSIAFKTPHQEDPMPAQDVRIAVAPLQKIVAHEYGEYGITANTIATGPFDSELSRDYRATKPAVKTEEWFLKMLPVRRWGQPREMGYLAAFLCSDCAAFLTGEVIRLDGGYTKSLF